MPRGATTLTKHVVEVRHVVWINKIQDVLEDWENLGWVDGNGLNWGGGFGKLAGGRETRGGGDGLEGPGKVKVLRVLKMMEHDSGAYIYGALVSVDTNDIFSNNEFPILDAGKKIISKDNSRI
uniref:Uncharacterized protein n=1 Tax=Tanacetum cinerariifolium TaxID=118510 RepID=A0A6L2KSN9_TANCI|nr:hypothetical protein [Tanacetum cinerariifolium]